MQVQILSPPPSLAEASYGGQGPPSRLRRRDMYYVYILLCSDGEPYTACTDNLKERIERHKKGYVLATKDRLPIRLISYFAFSNKYTAFDFEKYLKSGSGRAFLRKHKIIV
ncbi:MAG: GIY-YIG nuclease family protein [Candidatus Beckwithbacteria bacterium]|nr:GIY-YIG nuclease family protein [Candidatus Beckwithbacteria bacterium]